MPTDEDPQRLPQIGPEPQSLEIQEQPEFKQEEKQEVEKPTKESFLDNFECWRNLSNRAQAVILMNCFSLSQTIYQSLAKVATRDKGVDVIDLCLVRTLGNFLLAIPVLYVSKTHPIKGVPKDLRLTLIIRSIVGIVGFTTMVYATKYLPIFIVQIIFNTAPFWTSILGYFINHDAISWKQIMCMAGCFTGVVVLALAKTNIFGNSQEEVSEENQEKVDDKTMFYFGLGMISCTALGFSTVGVLTRKMKSIHFSIIQLDYGILSVSGLLAWILIEFAIKKNSEDPAAYGYDTLRILNYGSVQWVLLIVIAFMNAIGMNAFTLAFQKEQAAFIAMIAQIGVFYAFIGDFLVLQLEFEVLQFIGAFIILFSNITAVYFKLKGTN